MGSMSKSTLSSPVNCKKPVAFIIPRGPIGFEFSIKSNGPLIVISQVRPGGTAELAGLKCGSILKAVNQQSIDGLSFLQVSNMIRRTSGLTAEISVIEPDETTAVSSSHGSDSNFSSSSHGNSNGVVLCNTSTKTPVTAINSLASCSDAFQCESALPTGSGLSQGDQIPSWHAPCRCDEEAPDVKVKQRYHAPLASTAGSNRASPRRVRRQAVLFPQDSMYDTGPSDYSPRSIISDEGISNQDEFLDDVISTFNSPGGSVGHGELSRSSTSPLVRRQAYPQTIQQSVTSLPTTLGPAEGPRFLPAHRPTILSHETSPQPIFLPKLSFQLRKMSSPIISTEKNGNFCVTSAPSPPHKSSSDGPLFTNLAAYMEGLKVTQCRLSGQDDCSSPQMHYSSEAFLTKSDLNTKLSPSSSDHMRRRFSKREDETCLTKNTELFRTAQASRKSRYQMSNAFTPGEAPNATRLVGTLKGPHLRSLSVDSLDPKMESELYKSGPCLCKLVKVDGKIITPATWWRFCICICNGFIRFLLTSSEYHSFKSNKESDQGCSTSASSKPAPHSNGVLSHHCIVLPLKDLHWSSQPYIPSDVPTWSGYSSTGRRNPPSEMVEAETGMNNDLQCYVFEHGQNGGTKIIVIFPDRQTVATVLDLCQQRGGPFKENESARLMNTKNRNKYRSFDGGASDTKAAFRGARKSVPDPATRRKLMPDTSLKRKRNKSNDGLEGSDLAVGVENISNADGTSRFRFFSSTAVPFFRGIANAINNARVAPSPSPSPSNLPTSKTEQLALRIAGVLAEPPDLSGLNDPGSVFGAPLEKQLTSPDFPNVPLLLHTMVMALELNGLNYVGLYRAPGRQKEINRFVCLSNLTNYDPDVMLNLDVWNDVKTLTGIIKVFFRRLPMAIFSSELWEPLVSTTKGMEWNATSLTYVLQGVLAKLDKICRRLFSLWTTTSTTDIEHGKLLASRWFATVDFLFTHLRRLAALKEINKCSFECISVCFGPSLYDGSRDTLSEFNKILEIMIEHWPWLKAGLSVPTSDADTTNQNSASRCPDWKETKDYADAFFLNPNGNGKDADVVSASTIANISEDNKVMVDSSTNCTEVAEIISSVRKVFGRAGFLMNSVSRTESPNRVEKEREEAVEEESLLDVIMRSISATSDDENHEGTSNRQGDSKALRQTSVTSPIQRTNF